MNDLKTQAPQRLVIRRTFDFARGRVFAAFTRTEQMRQWMGPGDITIPDLQSDFRVGGAYAITMRLSDGELVKVGGVYREICEPERISYTWTWEEDAPQEQTETLVTVEFHELGADKTELVLTHEGFASDESRVNHDAGWNGSLDKFAAVLAA